LVTQGDPIKAHLPYHMAHVLKVDSLLISLFCLFNVPLMLLTPGQHISFRALLLTISPLSLPYQLIPRNIGVASVQPGIIRGLKNHHTYAIGGNWRILIVKSKSPQSKELFALAQIFIPSGTCPIIVCFGPCLFKNFHRNSSNPLFTVLGQLSIWDVPPFASLPALITWTRYQHRPESRVIISARPSALQASRLHVLSKTHLFSLAIGTMKHE